MMVLGKVCLWYCILSVLKRGRLETIQNLLDFVMVEKQSLKYWYCSTHKNIFLLVHTFALLALYWKVGCYYNNQGTSQCLKQPRPQPHKALLQSVSTEKARSRSFLVSAIECLSVCLKSTTLFFWGKKVRCLTMRDDKKKKMKAIFFFGF